MIGRTGTTTAARCPRSGGVPQRRRDEEMRWQLVTGVGGRASVRHTECSQTAQPNRIGKRSFSRPPPYFRTACNQPQQPQSQKPLSEIKASESGETRPFLEPLRSSSDPRKLALAIGRCNTSGSRKGNPPLGPLPLQRSEPGRVLQVPVVDLAGRFVRGRGFRTYQRVGTAAGKARFALRSCRVRRITPAGVPRCV